METLSAAREAALRTLYEIEVNGAYLNIALRKLLAEKRLSPRDNALATELTVGTVKNKLYLDNIISHLSNIKMKKISVWILNVLRIGIYSIKFLDKIPVSATVNECVRLARRFGHGASAGFVNAVLRKSTECGDFLPEEYVKKLSVKYSFPEWMVRMWEEYGEKFLASMNEKPQAFVRMNSLKTNTLGESFIKSDKAKFAYIYTGTGSVENTSEFAGGLLTVQDAASQIALELLGDIKNMNVLDLCAAPGGKTTCLAQMMENTGKIVSCDIHTHKLELIKNNLKRMGVLNTEVLLNDALLYNRNFKSRFDRVIADVPCSGLGIIRRKPDIKWTKTYNDIKTLVPIQEKILDNAAEYVNKCGILLFSTCTVTREENQNNVKRFLEKHTDFMPINEGKQFLPVHDGTDGFFVAAFRKKS